MVGGIYVEESIGEILKLIRIAHDKDIRDYCKEKEDLWWHKMDKHNEDW